MSHLHKHKSNEHSHEADEEKQRITPLSVIIAIFLMFLIIIMIVPFYAVKLDPEPKPVPKLSLSITKIPNRANSIWGINKFNLTQPVRDLSLRIISKACSSSKICYAKALYYYVRDNINYVSDPKRTEYVQSPEETLLGGGDCEDKAILTASILYKLGYDVCLIRFEDHMAVGVHLDNYPYMGKVYFTDDTGKRYLYLETSNRGWKLGEADEKYAHATNYTIYHVKDKPILIQYCRPPVRHQIGDEDFID